MFLLCVIFVFATVGVANDAMQHMNLKSVHPRDQPVRKGPTRSQSDNAHAGQLKKGMIVEVQVCDLQRVICLCCPCCCVHLNVHELEIYGRLQTCHLQEQRKDERGVLRMSIVVVDGKLKGWVRNSDSKGSLFENCAKAP